MSISVVCSNCGKALRAPDHAAGKAARCPKCGALVKIVALPPEPPPKVEEWIEEEFRVLGDPPRTHQEQVVSGSADQIVERPNPSIPDSKGTSAPRNSSGAASSPANAAHVPAIGQSPALPDQAAMLRKRHLPWARLRLSQWRACNMSMIRIGSIPFRPSNSI